MSIPLSLEMLLTLFIGSKRMDGHTHAALDLEVNDDETMFRVVYYMGEDGVECWRGTDKELAQQRWDALRDWIKTQPGQIPLEGLSFKDPSEEAAWLGEKQ